MIAQSGIWEGDLFGRRENAADLLAYIESLSSAGFLSGEQKSVVIAVDAEYGVGKTFFLKALAQQLESDHAVAYIDAWEDDFTNDPIVSLSSTLKEAIRPYLADERVRREWNDAASKIGKVLWIASKGLAFQGLKLAIGGGAVEGINAVVAGVGEETLNEIRDHVEDAVADTSEKSQSLTSGSDYLEERIAEAEVARRAIRELRAALNGLSAGLAVAEKQPVIYIIVDELDRCRPDYAISVLEQIKHLFSVKNVVFILGVNVKQLSKSVLVSYGSEFDGESYLNRFFDRVYRLPYPNLERMVDALWQKMPQQFLKVMQFPNLSLKKIVNEPAWISSLLSYYSVSPRDVFRFFDRLRTTVFLVKDHSLIGPYICEIIARDIGNLPEKKIRPWQIYIPGMYSKGEWVDGDTFFASCDGYSKLTRAELQRSYNENSVFDAYFHDFLGSQGGASDPNHYSDLILRVSRFVEPEASTSGSQP